MTRTIYLAIDRYDGGLWGVGDTPAEARECAEREGRRAGETYREEAERWERDLRLVRVELSCLLATTDGPGDDLRAVEAASRLIHAIMQIRAPYVRRDVLEGVEA